MGGRRAFRFLAVTAAALLGVGVVAAGTVDPPSPAPDGRVGAAGLSRSALADDESRSGMATETTVTVAPPAPVDTTRPAPSTTTTTVATTRTTVRSTTPALPPPPAGPPPTGIPNIAPASSWSAERDGVTARLRIDPPSPVAGQPVRIFIDVASAEACCTVMLDLGDATGGFSANNGVPCGSLTPGPKSFQTSHTYAAAGAYKATLSVMTGFTCQPPLQPGQAPSLPEFHSAALTACIAVGPGTAGEGGCSPFPTFGPDTLVSPVLDPFCQIRSDCTKASPPR